MKLQPIQLHQQQKVYQTTCDFFVDISRQNLFNELNRIDNLIKQETEKDIINMLMWWKVEEIAYSKECIRYHEIRKHLFEVGEL